MSVSRGGPFGGIFPQHLCFQDYFCLYRGDALLLVVENVQLRLGTV